MKAALAPEMETDSLKPSTVSEPQPEIPGKLADAPKEATAQFSVTKSRAFYIAARLYNSGSVDPSNKLEKGIATHCYSSDIANRLTGWVQAAHGCNLDG